MSPILLQEGEHGIGLGYQDFKNRFQIICDEHVKENRAKAFAFVFCNLGQGVTTSALHGEHGFRILNETSGNLMTIFYLHFSAREGATESFNEYFLRALSVEEQIEPPCIVCFRVSDGGAEDIAFHTIDERTGDPVLVVEQMRRHIQKYLDEMKSQGDFSALTDIKYLIPLTKFFKD